VPVALHTPSEVKAAVTGSGRADKRQVTEMVTRLLRLAEAPRPADSADALALAICHLWRGTAQHRMAAAKLAAAEVSGARVAAARVAAAQVSAAQIAAAQVAAAQVAAAQVAAVRLAAAKLARGGSR
jgi:crossover junction endodeoxyribonuclease RuvC